MHLVFPLCAYLYNSSFILETICVQTTHFELLILHFILMRVGSDEASVAFNLKSSF